MRVTLLDAVREMYRVSIERPGMTLVQCHSCRASKRLHFPVAMILSCLTLAACAHAQPENTLFVPKQPTMTTDATTPQGGKASVHPQLTAEQALLRLLELIRTSKTIANFTPERLEQVMGVPITSRGKGYGFAEQLTPRWSHGFDVSAWDRQTKFHYVFAPDPSPLPGTSDIPMTDICQIDFDKFTAELETMGFSRGSYYDSPPQPPSEEFRLPHGRLMYDYFDRPGMRIEVYPEGERVWTSEEGNGRACVKMLFIY